MTPEELRQDLAERVRALEASMAEVRSEQASSRAELAAMRREIGDVRQLVQALVPIGERTAVLLEQIDRVESDVTRVEGKFDKRWDRLESAQLDARKDSRSLRNLLIGVGIAAVLSPLGGLFVALVAEK